MSIARAFVALAAAMLLGSCGSTPPTAWYVLSADTPPADAAERPAVGIASLEVADYLLATQVLTMDGANRVRRAEFARWAEPLDEGVARVLALDLGARLATQGVRLAPWPREWVPDKELRVSIRRLDASADGVELIAAWSLQDGTRRAPPSDRLTHLTRVRSGIDAAAIAADFSALLAELAEVIAGAVNEAPGMEPGAR